MRAPRALACSSDSSSSTPAPSPMTKPDRSASKGRLAVCGESLAVVHMARMLVKPAKPSGVTAASVPPASITSASPSWMYFAASPIACVPVAHALTTAKLGPLAPSSMAIMDVAVLAMIDGRRNGVMRFGPFVRSILQLSSTASSPPTPEPMRQPNRLASRVFASSPPSAMHVLAAAIAKWVYRSYRLADLGSQYLATSKSFTSLAILTCASSGSKSVTGPMPHFPSSRLLKNVSASCPSEVKVPRPVTTTLRFRYPVHIRGLARLKRDSLRAAETAGKKAQSHGVSCKRRLRPRLIRRCSIAAAARREAVGGGSSAGL
mmetsp:Transcript_16115/g.40561  ORF Transcript_16115/g.40561 Transcript_16115/m.40561 type:complete len:319 (-) Transcript_16115:252-1208(-)